MLLETEGTVTKLDLEEISLPRQRKPPSHLTGIGAVHVYLSVSEYYRPLFYALIDTAVQQLKERFSNSPGLNKYRALEDILVSVVVDEQVLAAHHEIDPEVLQLQIRQFRRKPNIVSLREAANILKTMVPEVRGEFHEIEKRLLLVSPASSCEAERSFSSLRRLKTWAA
jgi:hypothetical protein